MTKTELHQERIRQITQLLSVKVEVFGQLEALRLMQQRINDLENILSCEYAHNHYLPPLEVDSEEFKRNPRKYIKISERRTVRTGSLSFGCGDPLYNTMGWCPVCNDITKAPTSNKHD